MLTETEFDQFVLEKMPHFIALRYQSMLQMEAPEDKIRAALHVYDLGLRALTMGLVSQYLVRDLDRVSDPYLNQLLSDRLPKASLETWQHLFFTTLRAYEGNRDVFFMPELYDFYWGIPDQSRLSVETTFARLTQIRHELDHGAKPTAVADWNKLLHETLTLLKEFLSRFIFIQNYELIRITDRTGQTCAYERHVGLTVTQHQVNLPEFTKLQPGWFYLSKEHREFLLLDPLLVFWQDPPSSLPVAINDHQDTDTAVFERFDYTQLKYLLSNLGTIFTDREHVDAFRQLIFDAIRKKRQVAQEIDQLTWWHLQEVASDISRQYMARVQGKYKPVLYLQRDKVNNAFHDFLTTDKRCFVLLGKSGVGKSNFILALQDEFGPNHHDVCLLMYDAANLNVEIPLTETISQTFKDYLGLSERKIENIWLEIKQIEEMKRRTVLLCIDAINENPQGQILLKQINELILGPWSWLKVIVTSRPEAWLTIKRGVMLAENLFYRESGSDRLAVEMENFTYSQKLEPFSTDELPHVYDKYRSIFEISTPYTSLSESVKQALRDPLVLWLTASTYHNKSIPDKIITTAAIPYYIEAMLHKETRRLERRDIEFLQATLMPIMIGDGHFANSITSQEIERQSQKLFEQINVEGKLSDGRQVNQSFFNLMDTEVLVRKDDAFNYEISFKYERFYDYFAGLRLRELYSHVEDRHQLYLDLVEQTKAHPFLWGAVKSLLLKDLQKDSQLAILLAQSKDYFVRELISSALVDLGRDYPEQIRSILTVLIGEKTAFLPVTRWGHKLLTQLKLSQPDKPDAQSSKFIAIEVASQLTIKEILLTAIEDPDQNVRIAAIQQIYHLLTLQETDLVFNILDELATRSLVAWRLPSFKSIEAYIVISLLILFNYFENPTIVTNLQARWSRITDKISFLGIGTGNSKRAKFSNQVRNIIVNIVVGFLIRAVKQIEESKIVVVSLDDFRESFRQPKEEKERLKRLAHYIDPGFGSIMDAREDLLSAATSRDLLVLYVIAVLFVARLLSEKDKTVVLAREVFQISLSQSPPTPIVTGILLALAASLTLRINTFDQEVWLLLEEMYREYYQHSRAITKALVRSYYWSDYQGYAYYHDLHIGGEDPPQLQDFLSELNQNKQWIELQIFVSFLAQNNIDHGLNHKSASKVLDFTEHTSPIISSTAIQAMASLRAKYPIEIDEMLKNSNIPLETRVSIENHRVYQNMGMIFTITLGYFWTRAILNRDNRVIDFLVWVAEYASECYTLRQWLAGMVNKVIDVIYQGNNELTVKS